MVREALDDLADPSIRASHGDNQSVWNSRQWINNEIVSRTGL
jgi:hypothetical protein